MAWVTTYDEILLTIAKNYKDIETSDSKSDLCWRFRTIILRKAPTEKPCGDPLFKMVVPRKYCIRAGRIYY